MFFKYQSNLFVVVQWVIMEWCMNWDSLLIAKLMSSLVREKYCNAPMTRLYSVESTVEASSSNFKGNEVESGFVTSLALSIIFFAKRSHMYLWCVKNNPWVVGITSMTRKKCDGLISLIENFCPSWVMIFATNFDSFPV